MWSTGQPSWPGALRPAPRYRGRVPSCTVGAKIRVHWREAGEPARTPVVWIHGGSVEDSSFVTEDLKPFLEHLWALYPDARGHGKSQKFERPEDYRYGAKCGDLLAWLDRLGVAEAVWGGVSMGGALALWAAVHAPERVRAVISVSGPPFAPPPEEKAYYAAHRHLVEAGRFHEYFDANVRLRMGEEALARLVARPERYAALTAPLAQHSRASLLALLDETYSRSDWVERCAEIGCPVQLVAGSEDRFPSPAMSAAVAAAIPGAALHTVAGGSHFPNRSHPQEVRAVIGAFLAEIGVIPGRGKDSPPR